METILEFSHRLLKTAAQQGDTVIDATAGNGHDTCLLAHLVGEQGKVYSFDIQEQAIINTQKKLEEEGLAHRVTLLQQGHETISQVFNEEAVISTAIFNLGYLPKGDKSIITLPDTTIQAFEGVLDRLKAGGIMVVVVYHGHPGGKEEKDAVENYLRLLDQTSFHVLKYEFINQKNNPPYILAVKKR
ncbi:MAG: class I SAM-dependent methyltransferase [Atopococcus tabaci]|uniref:Class I SAM-dependent methyltransferase n=1 Tax=Atopococcus tabaci TaxID=269774 RepID=A0AA43ZSG3_9LACT|nr:class I SAM-dependent methyltransferase [Atopococcus tabaci]